MTVPSFGKKIEKHAMLGICFWFFPVAVFPEEVFVMWIVDPDPVLLQEHLSSCQSGLKSSL
jgi:hypothetical protein